MKSLNTIMVIVSLIGARAIAQSEVPQFPIDPDTKKITYSEVIKLDSTIRKADLYSRAMEWFAKTYISSNEVIQMADREEGRIIGKAVMKVYYKSMGREYPSKLRYTVSIFVKQGRYKYEITDFIHETEGPCEEMIDSKKKVMGISMQRNYNFYLSQLDEYAKGLIQDIKMSMSKPPKKDDW